MRSATVIGGGLAGLCVARGLTRNGWHVRVIEAGAETGGLCGDVVLGGHRVERYYHHVFKAEKEIQSLIAEVGLGGDFKWFHVTQGSNVANAVGDACPKPGPGQAIARLLRDARFGMNVLTLGDITRLDDRTALEWLGGFYPVEVLDELWIPLLKKKFREHWADVSAWWLADRITARISSTNPFRGTETLGYLHGGFGRLTDALRDGIEREGGEVLCGVAVQGLEIDGDLVAGLRTGRGSLEGFDIVVSTLPRPALAGLHAFAQGCEVSGPAYMSCVCPILLTDRSLSDRYWISDSGDNPFCAIIEQSRLFPGPLNVVYLPDYVASARAPSALESAPLVDRSVTALAGVFPGFGPSSVIASALSFDAYCQPVFLKGGLKGRDRSDRAYRNLWITDPLDDFPNQTRGMAATVRRAAEMVRRIGHP